MSSVKWDGTLLTGQIEISGQLFNVSADRETIHQHAAGFDDALTWEIDRFRADIFDKLKVFFTDQHSAT